MSLKNPKPLTQDEIATLLRREFKKLNDNKLNTYNPLEAISVLADLYVKVSVNKL